MRSKIPSQVLAFNHCISGLQVFAAAETPCTHRQGPTHVDTHAVPSSVPPTAFPKSSGADSLQLELAPRLAGASS